MKLKNYVEGRWYAGTGRVKALHDAVTGEVIAECSTAGVDFAAALSYGRKQGGSALRKHTFHERAAMLKALAKYLTERKPELYELSYSTGATHDDALLDIDGGLSTLFFYAGKGSRDFPNKRFSLDGPPELVSRHGSFVGQHIRTPRAGVAVQINAFNFPCWGMLEKLAPALLAGMPVVVKPATATAYLTALMFRHMVESAILPAGAVQLLCGDVGDLFDHLGGQDVVAFTGSARTAQQLRAHPRVTAESVRFIAETDSLNCSVLGADAVPGTPEFELFVAEVVREMTVKSGQKCTAIRKAVVPAQSCEAVMGAIRAQLQQVVVGNPRSEGVTMGALAGLAQRIEVRDRIRQLLAETDLVFGDPLQVTVKDADAERGAFVSPLLLHCARPGPAQLVHELEAFGPVCTVMPYHDTEDAIELVQRSGGCLAASVFTANDQLALELVTGLAPHHGRILIVNRHCAKESTGHGSPLPHFVHGGPGRAGGGEELGGVRGVMHYLQRTALQGSPTTLTAMTATWIAGAATREPGVHPFRKTIHELQIGDTLVTAEREITGEDIERFAHLTGDVFYAHMDEREARRNPFFEGRVAHGYFIVALAAGLFVEPHFGPVLANYGLDNLRFTTPVYPGNRLKVRLTCKDKTLRVDKGYGEVRWDTEVTNEKGQICATYEVLTMVSESPLPARA